MVIYLFQCNIFLMKGIFEITLEDQLENYRGRSLGLYMYNPEHRDKHINETYIYI